METMLKTKTSGRTKQQVITPKRLSKAAIWREKHPDGIFVMVDRKAVMK